MADRPERAREIPPETLPGLRETVRAARPKRAATAEPVAAVDPVAHVLVETPLAHLDRPFDYAVPASMADTAVAGARVKVRFAGKDLDGYVVRRSAHTDHTGTLTPLRRVVSPEPVLSPAIAELAGLLAERYAGTRADVLRLAVPPRHATTEKKPSPPEEPVAGRPGGRHGGLACLPGGGGVPRPSGRWWLTAGCLVGPARGGLAPPARRGGRGHARRRARKRALRPRPS